jgi:ribosomal 50S subunit-associated protein YjgA (DUF615 family)
MRPMDDLMIAEHLENLDRRLARVEQILPTLATKDDLKTLATKEELREEGERSRRHTDEVGERARRHMDVVAESLRSDIQLIAEHVASTRPKHT